MSRRVSLILAWLLAVSAAGPARAAEQAFQLNWTICRKLADVRAIHPHPTDPQVAWAITGKGLFKTADEGRTFQPVASATTEKLGQITAIACRPADENCLLVGTDANGLFISTDGAASFKPMSSKAEKLASQHVAHVDFSRIDPSWRTVMVTHALGAPGMSVTRDLGKTWEAFGQDRYLKSFAFCGPTIVAVGSMAAMEGRTWGIHRSAWDAQRWEESNRGIRPGEPACELLRPNRFLFSTLDGVILESHDDGRTWQNAARIGPGQWVSVLLTHGATDNTELAAAYDPHGRGLVISTRLLRRGSLVPQNTGLYVGPYIKSGASCRASANGLTWYIVMNNWLWIGRRVPRKVAPTVLQAWCSPSSLWVAFDAVGGAQSTMHTRLASIATGSATEGDVKALAAAHKSFSALKGSMGFGVLAKVSHPKGPRSIKSVTVDLSIIGGSALTQLHDDGKHGDGKGGDGLWGTQVRFLPGDFPSLPRHDRRWGLPANTRSAMTVTALGTSGQKDSHSAVIAIRRKPAPVSIWPGGRRFRFAGEIVEGTVTVSQHVDRQRDPNNPALLVQATGPGPWRAAWHIGEGRLNISGCDTLRLDIKGTVNQELYVHILDYFRMGENMIDVPHWSRGVPLIAGGHLKSIGGEYQTVRIPMKLLLTKGTLFLRQYGAGIGLATKEGGKPGAYYLANVTAEP